MYIIPQLTKDLNKLNCNNSVMKTAIFFTNEKIHFVMVHQMIVQLRSFARDTTNKGKSVVGILQL